MSAVDTTVNPDATSAAWTSLVESEAAGVGLGVVGVAFVGEAATGATDDMEGDGAAHPARRVQSKPTANTFTMARRYANEPGSGAIATPRERTPA
jgi:hypothetical protein